MTDIREIVELIEEAGFRCGHGSEQEARAEGCDFWCPDDELPVPLTVEADRCIDLAHAVATKIALFMVRGDPEGYLAQVGIADDPSAGLH